MSGFRLEFLRILKMWNMSSWWWQATPHPEWGGTVDPWYIFNVKYLVDRSFSHFPHPEKFAALQRWGLYSILHKWRGTSQKKKTQKNISDVDQPRPTYTGRGETWKWPWTFLFEADFLRILPWYSSPFFHHHLGENTEYFRSFFPSTKSSQI